MIWQDLTFMVLGFAFAPSLWFMIKSKHKPPIATSLPTAIVLTVYIGVYVSMGFWLAVVSSSLTATSWWILFIQRRNSGQE